MKRKTLILFAILALAASASAQQRYIADKVVAVVGSSPILYSDVVEQARMLTEHYRSQNFTSPREPMAEALEMLMEQKLLFQRAQIDSIGLENLAGQVADMVDRNVEALITEAGSLKAFEAEQRKPVYVVKDEMRGEVEEYYGAQEMKSYLNRQVKVTPGEVDRFYRRIDPDSLPIIPEQYVYAQITKQPRSAELAKQRARERLLDLRQRIIDGEKFETLARAYSVDPGSMMQGGDLGVAPKENWHEEFGNAMAKLQPGQVSGVVETPDGFHIIQLIEKPSENLYHSRHILLKPQYTVEEQAEAIDFLDSLAGVIRRDEITFEEAAKQHSDDTATKMNGGLVSNQEMLSRYMGVTDPRETRTRFIKDELLPADAMQLIRMNVGEISKAYLGQNMRMDEMGKMLRLVEIIPSHKANLSDDWLDVERLALRRKQDIHYKTWLDAKIDEMYVRIDPMFSPDDFLNKRWFK